MVVFGSVGRRTPRPDSDMDILIVAKDLPKGRMARVREFGDIEVDLSHSLDEAIRRGVGAELSPVFKVIALCLPLMKVFHRERPISDAGSFGSIGSPTERAVVLPVGEGNHPDTAGSCVQSFMGNPKLGSNTTGSVSDKRSLIAGVSLSPGVTRGKSAADERITGSSAPACCTGTRPATKMAITTTKLHIHTDLFILKPPFF